MTLAEPLTRRFSQRMSAANTSAVREILKVAAQPGILSLAGGLPAPELFPVQELAEAYTAVLREDGPAALQYSTTEGYIPLREWIAARMAGQGCALTADDIVITSGSQQGIDLVGRVLLDPGDCVIMESPSYLAAIQAFRICQARLCAIPSDEHGMCVDDLEEAIRRHQPRLIYLVANFQNPSGSTLSLDRRRKLAQIAGRYGVPVLEDDPYGELRYRGDHLPSIQSFDRDGVVIGLGTFSKTLAPGLRIAWVATPPWLHHKLVVAKQAADLHSGTIDQRVVYHYLAHHSYDDRLDRLRAAYGERYEIMRQAMAEHLPSTAHWDEPDGGMFFWVRLDGQVDSMDLFHRAIKKKVAFVPGAPFFPEGGGENYLRLNFSNGSPADLREGLRRLGEVMRQS